MLGFLLVFLFSSPLLAKIQPSFNCHSSPLSPVEQAICQDPALATYDVLLNDLYQLLLQHIPPREKQNLRTEQRLWLQKERVEAFLKEENIKTHNTFPKETYPEGWANRLILAYGERIQALCKKYEKKLGQIFYTHLKTASSPEALSTILNPNLFFVWFYTRSYEESRSRTGVYDPLLAEDRLLRTSSGLWLLVWRGNEYFQITNKDGGIYQFYTIDPQKQAITLVKIEEFSSYEEKPKKVNEVQAYLWEIKGDKVILAQGGYLEEGEGSLSTPKPDVLFTYRFQPTPPLMVLEKVTPPQKKVSP